MVLAPADGYGGGMKDEELPDDWPGAPVSVRALVDHDGKLAAVIDGERVEPDAVPDLAAAMARSKAMDRDQ